MLRRSFDAFCINFDLRFRFSAAPVFFKTEADLYINQKNVVPTRMALTHFTNEVYDRWTHQHP